MFKSSILVMIITFASRFLGLIRGSLIAYLFGQSHLTDAYFSAFKISNFFRQVLGEGALGTVFIPIYNEKEKNEGKEKAHDLIFSILNLLFIFTTLITIVMIIFSDQIIGFIVGGFSDETQFYASIMLKIMAVYFVFIGLAGMISAILNNFKHFLVPASTSLFFNIAIIASAKFLSGRFGIYSLAIGVVIGGILQFLVVLPTFFKLMKTYKFKIDFKDPDLRRVFILILPMLVGVFAQQLNTIVNQLFASFLSDGTVSALENATRVYQLPLGVFGVSISTVIYPTLSRAMSNKDYDSAKDSLRMGLNFLQFLILPSIAVLTFYSNDVIRLILGRGKFGEDAITVSGEALTFYALGLFFYTGIYLLARGFYGMKDTKTPVKFSVSSILLNIILCALLYKSMAHKGLALASAISSGVNFVLLYVVFNKKYFQLDHTKIFTFTLKVVTTIAVAVFASMNIENTILKLIVFSLAYMVFWAYPLLKKRTDVF